MNTRLHVRMITIVVLALSLAVMAACYPPTNLPSGVSGRSTPVGGTGTPAANTIEGIDWQLVSVGGTPAVSGAEATVRLENGMASGSTGCNGYSASYELSGADGIEFGLLTSTLMACDGPIMTQEQAFGAALTAAARYTISADTLTLQDASGATLALFAPRQQASLTGTTWIATAINNGRQAVTSVVSQSEVTAVFGADGNLAGRAGCNQYGAQYRMDGDRLTIEAPIHTEMFCDAPGVMEQETAYLLALPTVASYNIDGDRLQLRSADDALQVDFRAQR